MTMYIHHIILRLIYRALSPASTGGRSRRSPYTCPHHTCPYQMAASSSLEWPVPHPPSVSFAEDALVEAARQQGELYGAAFMTFEINVDDPLHHCILEVGSEYRASTCCNPGHDYDPLCVRLLASSCYTWDPTPTYSRATGR